MSKYTTSRNIRYSIPSIQAQIEVAVINASQDILNEDTNTPDHEDRAKWAHWANHFSTAAWQPFGWSVAMNPAIQAAVESDPTGQSVSDSDVQFVVNSFLPVVIREFIANPPPSVPVVIRELTNNPAALS